MAANAQTSQNFVQITGIGIHYGGYVEYRYTIKNMGTKNVSRIRLGYSYADNRGFKGFSDWPEDPTVTLPLLSQWIPAPYIASPEGWGGRLFAFDHEVNSMDGVGVEWIEASYVKQQFPMLSTTTNAPRFYPGGKAIAPSGFSNEFSLRVQKADAAYMNGYAYVVYGNNWIYIPIEKLDTTPPKLTLALTPNVIGPGEKLVTINASIAVNDDIDPAPEIRLESITSNQITEAEDIRARLKTDARQFTLSAKSSSKTGRIYTVTYSATDASGNRTTSSATVTALHDNRDGEKK